ncbi:MAG: B12-binding domain-containing radical SAM protein [Candidatus Thermoplasmatota archaeon]|nr:B12-binding domain-containing radical SAM protein [Candidatus Thermoplasmatota archaeon]MBU4255627.1 B12-binding domain-containing radical SAM protein [Candidatus Thermoplasmatota archaeon]
MSDVTLVNGIFPSSTPVPPLGLLYLTSSLKAFGYSVDLKDYQLADYTDPKAPHNFVNFLRDSADIIGISTMSFSLPFIILSLKEFKEKYPNKIVVLGGIGASGVAEPILRHFPFVDYVIRGEGEHAFVQFMDMVEGKKSVETVEGLSYRKNNNCVHNPQRRIQNLDDLLLPAYETVDLKRYVAVDVLTSRGCPYHCSFCDVAPYWGWKNYKRNIEKVVEEIKLLSDQNHVRNIAIIDDTFILDKKRVINFCNLLRKENIAVRWGCYGRVDLMDVELMETMSRIGCVKIYYGIESGSDTILSVIEKKLTTKKNIDVVLRSTNYFECVQTSYVWGFPFETMEDFYDTVFQMLYFAKKGVSIKGNIVTPFPFSSLYKQYKHTLKFSEYLCPQVLMSGYMGNDDILKIIKKYPDVFPAFYYYDCANVHEKYKIMKSLKLAPEDIFDIWETDELH